jgi:hypothetical protein
MRALDGHATDHGDGAAYVAAADTFGVTLASCDERDLVRPGLAVPPRACLPAE